MGGVTTIFAKSVAALIWYIMFISYADPHFSYRTFSSISHIKSQNLNVYRLNVFAQSIQARC